MSKIVLATLNARYSHTSIGLRYLLANLNELKKDAYLKEFVINENLYEIAEKILSEKPVIIGLGVYIWNASDIEKLISIIKKISPEIKIILGGPEASHLPFRVDLSKADYIIQGEGEFEFYKLCSSILNNDFPKEKIIKAEHADLQNIKLPYAFYSTHDIQNRVIYVEASRGCPFNCEFCLSSIDKTVRYFDVEIILAEFENLWLRGTRKFKFIDRTFNLNVKIAEKILDFFLSKIPECMLHFEVIPENFPAVIKEKLKLFPPASIQLEIGIQTLNSQIAKNINRNLNFEKIKENLDFLEHQTNAHLHVDLIVGLPGESLESFAENLNSLAKLTSSEIQIGILKKLSGTTISRHDEIYGAVYSDLPPYEILKNNLIEFSQMQRMKRFARYWDLTYNSGDFAETVKIIFGENVYENFSGFCDWIYDQTESTHNFSLNRLSELIFKYLTEIKGKNKTVISNLMIKDILKISGRKIPVFLKEFASEIPEVERKTAEKQNKRQIKRI